MKIKGRTKKKTLLRACVTLLGVNKYTSFKPFKCNIIDRIILHFLKYFNHGASKKCPSPKESN